MAMTRAKRALFLMHGKQDRASIFVYPFFSHALHSFSPPSLHRSRKKLKQTLILFRTEVPNECCTSSSECREAYRYVPFPPFYSLSFVLLFSFLFLFLNHFLITNLDMEENQCRRRTRVTLHAVLLQRKRPNKGLRINPRSGKTLVLTLSFFL